MGNPRKRTERSHYVTRFYLDNFSSQGLLWVYDKETKEFRQQSPVNTCVIRNYYQYHEDLESTLSVIEGMTAPIIRKLLSVQQITHDELNIITFFVALMGVRVPRFEKALNKSIHHYYYEDLREILSTVESTQKMISEYESETGKHTGLNPQDIMEYFDAGKIEILDDRNASLSLMFPLAIAISQRIYPMSWSIIIPPRETSFITTDDPFVVLMPQGDNNGPKSNEELISSGSQIFFPIGSNACIALEDNKSGFQFVTTNRKGVRKINVAIAGHSKKYIIARDRIHLDSLVRALSK